MKKKTWKKPPRKIYLTMEKGYVAGLGEVDFKKNLIQRDIGSTLEYYPDAELRIYEYVLVEKPLMETNVK